MLGDTVPDGVGVAGAEEVDGAAAAAVGVVGTGGGEAGEIAGSAGADTGAGVVVGVGADTGAEGAAETEGGGVAGAGTPLVTDFPITGSNAFNASYAPELLDAIFR